MPSLRVTRASKEAPKKTKEEPRKETKPSKKVASKKARSQQATTPVISEKTMARISAAIAAHNILHGVGSKLHEAMRRHPLNGLPLGDAKSRTLTVAMPAHLFKASRVGKYPTTKSWKVTERSKAATAHKLSVAKEAERLHREAFEDEGEEENVESWADLPADRQAAYQDKAATEVDKLTPLDESSIDSKICTCTTAQVNHSILGLPKEGVPIMQVLSGTGTQRVYANIHRLTMTYDFRAEELTVRISSKYVVFT